MSLFVRVTDDLFIPNFERFLYIFIILFLASQVMEKVTFKTMRPTLHTRLRQDF